MRPFTPTRKTKQQKPRKDERTLSVRECFQKECAGWADAERAKQQEPRKRRKDERTLSVRECFQKECAEWADAELKIERQK